MSHKHLIQDFRPQVCLAVRLYKFLCAVLSQVSAVTGGSVSWNFAEAAQGWCTMNLQNFMSFLLFSLKFQHSFYCYLEPWTL